MRAAPIAHVVGPGQRPARPGTGGRGWAGIDASSNAEIDGAGLQESHHGWDPLGDRTMGVSRDATVTTLIFARIGDSLRGQRVEVRV